MLSGVQPVPLLLGLTIVLSLSVRTHGSEKAKYPLLEATQAGDAARVKSLLTQEVQAGERDAALHAAVRSGHREIVELLVARGADVNAIKSGSFTPLLVAVTGGASVQTLQSFTNWPLTRAANRPTSIKRSPVPPEVFRDIAAYLLEHGANVNAQEKQNGFGPLHYAIFGGDAKMVGLLLDHGAQPNPAVSAALQSYRYVTPLHLAAGYGNLAICELLVQRGAEVSAQMPKDFALWTGNARQTPLHRAVYSGNAKLVEFLIGHGAQVDATDSEDETPLHIAVQRKDRTVVEVLLSHGADPNRKSKSGQTPTSIATQNGGEGIVRLLLARQGQMTIHSAASLGDVEVLMRFVAGGSGVNRLDVQGRTALHAAVATGQVGAVELLLDHGANVNLADDQGDTALSLALRIAQESNSRPDPNEIAQVTPMERRQRDIIARLIRHKAALDYSYGMSAETVQSHAAQVTAVLIDAGVNFEPSDDRQATLLHRAAWWGHQEAVKTLLGLGANVNAPDGVGGTPLHAAMHSGCTR